MFARKGKRSLALLLTVVMLMSLLPFSALATGSTSADQIEQNGSGSYLYHTLDSNGASTGSSTDATATSAGGKVEISKVISGTSQENVFDITLTVKTKQATNTITTSPDAAAVLVLDASTSMDGSKLTNAKAAAIEFAQTFAANANGAKRWIAVVKFSRGSSRVLDWTDAAALTWGSTPNNAITQAINGITTDTYTDPEAGLQVAYNLFHHSTLSASVSGVDKAKEFVVLMTDGSPNAYISTSVSASDRNSAIAFTNSQITTDYYMTYGSTTAANKAAAVAANITGTGTDQLGIKLYSICYGASNDYIGFGSGRYTVLTWLGNISSAVYTAANSDSINQTFTSIITQIQLIAQAGTVTDPMGQYIVFDSAYNSTNNDITTDDGTSLRDYDSSTRTLTWNTNGSTPTQSGDWYIYTLSYRVSLNTAASGFQENTYYLTNGVTTLSYAFYDGTGRLMDEAGNYIYNTDGSINTSSDQCTTLRTLAFKVPAVKGCVGSFSFQKTAAYNGQALNGATFTLTSTDGTITKTAVSGANGTDGEVSFTNIPSGYTYTLTETAAPTGYDVNSTVYNVAVAYGQVTENVPDTVTNDLTQTYKDITITKIWQKPNTVSTKPITVQLLQDGSAYAQYTLSASDVTVSSDGNTWTYTVQVPDNIPSTGGSHSYSVTESTLEGFSTSIEGLSITNTATGTTSVTVKKQWVLPASITTAPTVTVELLRNGSPLNPAVTTTLSGNGATDTFTNLPMYSSGGQTAYTYSVREVIPSDATYRQTGSIPGTGTSEDPFVITNTVNDEITSVSGTKTWNYPDGTVAPAITINLYQDGGTDPIDSITLDGTADENGETSPWHYSFTGLHRYSFTTVGGVVTAVREIAYSVAEAPVEGYTSHKSGNNFTNTITGTTSLTVNKVWVDVDDATHGDITVQLCANGEAIEGVTATFSGSHTFEGLDQYDSDGKIISYSVTEDDIEGYNNTGNTVVRNEDGTFTVTLTNTLQQDTVTVVVKKTWKQPGDVTPPDVTFTLYADGEVVKDSHGDDMTLTLTSGTLTGSFSNLSKYKYVEVTITEAVPDDPNTPEDESAPAETEMQAVPIEYAVVETALSNYAQTGGDQDLDPTDDFEYDFTNTITGTTSVTVEKVWEDLTTDDDRTASATITLYRSVNGGEAEAVDADAFVTSKDETHTWSELPKYDGDGNLYTYTVQEAAPAGYSTGAITGTGTSEDPYQVTNTINQAYTTFTVTKTWIDGGSDSRPTITIKLWRSDNTETPYDTYEMHNTETTHTFGLAEDGETAALPVYNEGRTAAYTYYVTEDQVSGYDAPSIQGGSITNTLTQETDATKTVTKYWVDPEGTEHPDVTFRLSANGEEISSVTVGFGSGATAPTTGTLTSDTWSYTWTGLDKYDSDRELIDYTVSEDDVAGYTKADVTSDAGAAFRNTIAQDYITITGEKLWANMGGSGVNTPASVSGILVQLYQDGNAYGDPLSVPVDNGDGEADWSFSWSELEVYNLSSGSKYVYTVKEGYMNGETFVPVNGGGTITYGNDSYTVSYTTYESDHYYEITNTYQVPQQYYYRIDLNYSTFVEGTQTGSTYVQGTLQSSGTGGTVTADPDDYKVYNGLTYDYSAAGSTLSVELEINQIKVITINYTHSSSGGGGDDPDPNPVYYTVQYTFSGSHPDATLPADETYVRNTKVQVADGYDDVTTADGVWHFNGWSRTEEFRITGNTTITGTWTFTPNETTIVEEEPPLGEPPVTEEPPVEIEEPEIPLGNLPQTGTAAAPVNPMWTLGMLALSFSLAAAGLTITFGRRKDEAQK